MSALDDFNEAIDAYAGAETSAQVAAAVSAQAAAIRDLSPEGSGLDPDLKPYVLPCAQEIADTPNVLILTRYVGSPPDSWSGNRALTRMCIRTFIWGDFPAWFTIGSADPADGPTHRVEGSWPSYTITIHESAV